MLETNFTYCSPFTQAEVEGMRKHQRQTRERRDHLFRRRGEVKKAEDGLKRDQNTIRDDLEKVKVRAKNLGKFPYHCSVQFLPLSFF